MKKNLLFIILVFVLFIPFQVKAESSKTVVINELMWSGSLRSFADEWIELRNLTNKDVDISGWQIEGAGTGGSFLIIPEGNTIKASGFFLISNYSKNSDKTILDMESDCVTSSISLRNSDPKYFLKDRKGDIVDEIEKGEGEPLAGNNKLKYSMERGDIPSDGTKSKDWHTATSSLGLKESSTEKATPGFSNSPPLNLKILKIKEAKNVEGAIKVSGIITTLPNGFFEKRLYIQDETDGIRLKLNFDAWPQVSLGSKITVKGKISTYYTEKEIVITDSSEIEIEKVEEISPFVIKTGEISLYEGAFVKIRGIVTKSSGDTFWIDDGSGEVKIYIKESTDIKRPNKRKGDKAEVIGIVNNWSGNFRILPRISGDIVIIPHVKPEKDVKSLSIKEAKKQKKGTKVKVKGTVSVTPFVLSKQYFYIQDNEAGIQIYSYYKDFPALKLGLFIEVTGEISEIYGEKRIKIKNPQNIIILEEKLPPIPRRIRIRDIPKFGGMLVKVRGTVVKTSGNTFYISDGTREIKIYIQKLTGIKKPRLHKGDIVEISGIVSKTKTGYRVLPRYQSDFKLVWTKPKKEKKSKIKSALAFKNNAINEPKVIFEARKERGSGLLSLIGWGLIIFSLGSLVYLKKLGFQEKRV